MHLFSNRSQMTLKCISNLEQKNEPCVTNLLATFQHLLWSITEQTHGNRESVCFNPFITTHDQDRISPNNINTISSRQVMRTKKNIS